MSTAPKKVRRLKNKLRRNEVSPEQYFAKMAMLEPSLTLRQLGNLGMIPKAPPPKTTRLFTPLSGWLKPKKGGAPKKPRFGWVRRSLRLWREKSKRSGGAESE